MKNMCEFHGSQEGEVCPLCPSVKVPPLNCLITSCKGKDNCLQHCPCDCHLTATQIASDMAIYRKGFGDGHKDSREYTKKLIKDEIWTHHKLGDNFGMTLEQSKKVNEIVLKAHNEVLEMLIELL